MMMADAKKLTPEMLADLVDRLPTIGSLRDLCAATGLDLDTVRRETAPFLAIMKLQVTHPKCGCGKDRFHPYGCVENVTKVARPVPARRVQIIDMLIAGDRFVDINNALGLYPKTARKYLRFLSDDQLAERERKVAERTSPNSETPQ